MTVFVVPHSHYDYLWMYPPDEMGAKFSKIIKEALLIMRKHPEYKFIIDSTLAIDYFELHYPDMMEELYQRHEDGNIGFVGGMVVAPDTLLPNGESLVRQILYSDFPCQIAYLIDSFGLTPQLPQILSKAGMKLLIWMRGMNRNLPAEFYYKGLDGSKILTHHLSSGYTYILPHIKSLGKLTLGLKILGVDFGGLRYTINKRCKQTKTNDVLVLAGSDNTRPKSAILKGVGLMKKRCKDINITLLGDFAKKIIPQKHGVFGPHEFNPEFTGTYCGRISLKQKIRSLENLVYIAELIASIEDLYSRRQFKEDIKRILCADFHDGITGTHVDSAYDYLMKRLDRSKRSLMAIMNLCFWSFSKKINTMFGYNVPLLIFNPLGTTRTQVTRAKIPYKYFILYDEDGYRVNYQKDMLVSDDDVYLFIAKNIPPVGYKVYNIVPIEEKNIPIIIKEQYYTEGEKSFEFGQI